jgi:hypothetical protein
MELHDIIQAGPDPEIRGVVRWRRVDLAGVIEARFGAVYSERGISALLARLSFSRITGRPQHPGQDPKVIEDLKKLRRTLKAHIGHLTLTSSALSARCMARAPL